MYYIFHTAQTITDFYTVVTRIHTHVVHTVVTRIHTHVVHRAALRQRHARHDQHTTTLYALSMIILIPATKCDTHGCCQLFGHISTVQFLIVATLRRNKIDVVGVGKYNVGWTTCFCH